MDLSPLGQEQAAALASYLQTVPFDAIYASPMKRVQQTLQKLLEVQNRNPTVLEQLREVDFGAWTGRRHNDLVTELGETYRDFWKSPAGNRPPGGESFVDQIVRATEGLAALPAGDVVLVVHSGTIRAALAIALGLEPAGALRFVIDPLSLTRIDRLENGWRVVAVNTRR